MNETESSLLTRLVMIQDQLSVVRNPLHVTKLIKWMEIVEWKLQESRKKAG